MTEQANEQQQPTTAATTTPATAPAQNAGDSGQDPNWLPERLERAKRTAQAELLKSIGLDSPDALKALVDEAKKLKESQMTEGEKTAAKLKAAEDKAAAAEKRISELEQARVTDRVNRVLEKAAKDAKNATHVLKLIRDEKPDAVAALVDDKGEIDEKKAEKLIAEFRQANPDYFGKGGVGSPSNAGGRVPDATLKDAQKRASITNQRIIRG